MEDKKTDNMELWEQVCVTDPAITKEVQTRGGFTAICAQAQIKRATELWGSYGGKWGVKDCKYMFLSNEKMAELALSAVFYYPGGKFEMATDMAFKLGNDSRKKLLTDLTTKALSKLGFNSDIFEGKGPLGFSDNKDTDQPEPISKADIEGLQRLIDETDSKGDRLDNYLKANFGVLKIEDLSAADAIKVNGMLQGRLDEQNA